ncbi:MAG TPA: DNA polymerase III subunit alpha, partial [Flavobacteriales bacterium]|nr:DNA polymerase III subunit alpha [Flavobacteriales bacterium]
LYLKAHHPLEFLVGVANNFGGFYHTEFYLHEAKRAGATIEAPCINTSEEYCSLHGTRIYLGFGNVKSIETEVRQLILHDRARNGPFHDLQDLLTRVPLHVEQARLLIRVGALRFTGKSKPALLWELTLLHRPAMVSTTGDLFITKVEEPRLPDLQHYPLADSYDELDLLGFPLCDPFTLAQDPKDSDHAPRILKRDMLAHVGKCVTMLGYLIHVKTTDTRHGQRMTFGSFIDTAGDFWDSSQFPDVAARYSFRGRGVYRLTGIVEEEFGHVALRTQQFEKLPWKPDPRYGEK